MKLVDGFYDFKQAAELAPAIGKYPAWQAYYNKYKAAFDPLFSSLYKLDEESIQTTVGQLNFQDLLLQSEKGQIQFPLKKIEAILKKCCTYFDFHEDFTVYLLTGVGYSDGAALPSSDPFIYLGLELLEEKDPEILIPHEFSHMARFYRLKGKENFNALTAGQLAAAEGLAVWASVELSGRGPDDASIAEALMMSPYHYRTLQLSLAELEEVILNDLDRPLDRRMLEKYFTGTEAEGRSGYFAGAQIINSLMSGGMSLKGLNFMETDKIMKAFYSYKKSHCFKGMMAETENNM
ncbi:hypothetical protein EVU96_10870 [Bacillus infantis]|uniref:hypothetical protein n=1 Tax=Bacillus infantis TaxID=324767 RepID=UPI00101D5B74|nr:hypothetical protein [Bacillus infantis]RYI29492.1 hypothetical protein EVU96_10870 [Bacillus infantis]